MPGRPPSASSPREEFYQKYWPFEGCASFCPGAEDGLFAAACEQTITAAREFVLDQTRDQVDGSHGSASAWAWRKRVSRISAIPPSRSWRSARSSSSTFMVGPPDELGFERSAKGESDATKIAYFLTLIGDAIRKPLLVRYLVGCARPCQVLCATQYQPSLVDQLRNVHQNCGRAIFAPALTV